MLTILKLEGHIFEDVQQTVTTYWTGLSFISLGVDNKNLKCEYH